MRFDPSTLIARTRAQAFEEAASRVSAYMHHLARAERAKIPTRDNRITDCIEIDTPSPYPLADSGLDGI